MDLVEQFRLPLSAASQEQWRRDTDDAEAHQLYLKGRSALQKSRAGRPVDPTPPRTQSRPWRTSRRRSTATPGTRWRTRASPMSI